MIRPVGGMFNVGTVMPKSFFKAFASVDMKSLSVKLTWLGEKESRTAIWKLLAEIKFLYLKGREKQLIAIQVMRAEDGEGGIRERKMRWRTCSVLASCGKIHMPLRYKSVELDAIVTRPVFSTSDMILLRVPLPRSGIPNAVSTSDNDC